jgi:hypothetical protein
VDGVNWFIWQWNDRRWPVSRVRKHTYRKGEGRRWSEWLGQMDRHTSSEVLWSLQCRCTWDWARPRTRGCSTHRSTDGAEDDADRPCSCTDSTASSAHSYCSVYVITRYWYRSLGLHRKLFETYHANQNRVTTDFAPRRTRFSLLKVWPALRDASQNFGTGSGCSCSRSTQFLTSGRRK